MSLYDAAYSFTNRNGTPQPIPTNANAITSHGLIYTERRLQDDARFYSIGCQALDDTKTVWQTYTPTAKTTLYKVRARGTDVSVRVPITRHGSTNQALALKCMPKALVVENYLQKNVIYEKGIIAECDRPITFKLREMYQEANQASGKDTSAIGIVRRGDRWVV
ncbi:hypothetical protein PHYSODRAFT_263052 [Phytophthora sojae]|uniref:Uncharacterized protein n=1 Tax=Phytophthora sojae (strain P6497) TaxID=1094619 RepID=G4ZKJ3_PHYSP|nr:hypothetical protein PHYSODRAFT_263052 [Phytophthora sojae]EGZ15935.1 hypothetical protein PHYSODRAFT_263052 [Phytophthora sojae]|eukprot:XP_009529684.1 hypothetical protein PHYSODRAFT_263052 [Phytophthora sojae]